MPGLPPRREIEDDPALSDGELLALYRRMREIRAFEDEVQLAFTNGLVRGSTHLCNGQEATAVGACSALRPGDTMVCTYRGHGAVLAMGAPLDRTFAEIVGRSTGLCAGKGGSMHLTDVGVGAYGSFAIVGAHLPIAAGLALAAQRAGRGEVALCLFGDGSVNIGAFHEALNLAGIWRLPVVFFCENNLYGEYSAQRFTTPVDRIADRAASYGIPGVQVDGNDVIAVRRVTAEAVQQARAGEGATLIEGVTYRHRGHSRADPAKYRPAGELEQWLEYDPVGRLERLLTARGVPEPTLSETSREASAAVTAARDAALAAEPPAAATLLEDVFA